MVMKAIKIVVLVALLAIAISYRCHVKRLLDTSVMIIEVIHAQSIGLFNGNRYLLSMLCHRVVGLLMEACAIVYGNLDYKDHACELYPGIANGRMLTVELYMLQANHIIRHFAKCLKILVIF